MSILNSTFMNNITTDNNSSTASLYLQGTKVDVRNTIVALSLALDVDHDADALVSFDCSLIQTSSAAATLALLAGTGNITGVDPDLGAAEVQQGLAATGSVDVTATLAGGILLSLTGLVLLAARGARKRVA